PGCTPPVHVETLGPQSDPHINISDLYVGKGRNLMQERSLGKQGLTVSAIGYGAMGTAVGYGSSDDTESIAAIRRAHELGVTHFDTAEMYGWGEGEKLLGQALAPIRDEVTIATKFGLTASFG